MRIIKIEPMKNRRMRVCLEDETDFLLYRKELNQFGLREDMELDDDLMGRILKEVLCPRAAKRAMFLLEQQDRSEKNLREKLEDSGYPDEAVDYAIAYVTKFHYLDDRRMAENYIRCHQSDRSRQRIRQDLMKKGIRREVIDLALEEEYRASEEDQITELLRRKHYDPETADRKEKAKMYRFLAYRGFSGSDIMNALR